MHQGADPEIQRIGSAREEVLTRYQPLFSREYIRDLSEEAFRGLLKFSNKRLRLSLQRLGGRVTEDMEAL